MTLNRREFVAASAAAAASVPKHSLSPSGPIFHPEDFGAKGDGATNDTAAFQRLSKAVNDRGGGTISFRAKHTYVVGAQTPTPRHGWSPEPILELHDLTAPLIILGNGARLLAQVGMRFGTFDLETGEPVQHPMPYVKPVDLAQLYRGMIWIHDCRAPISVSNVELDGNLRKLRVGGKYGDTGWQIGATGLFLVKNLASEHIENVYTHHHATDGAMIVGDPGRSGRTTVSRLVSRYNGRQGLSITGGHGYDLADCEFSHTGRAGISSAPGAGVDIEAENPPIRDVNFTRCAFVDNSGCGLVADSGDSADAHFIACRFVGTTQWSAWPKKPGFRFSGCTFAGSVVHAYPDNDPERAAHFTNCIFTDDPKLSPNGQVYVGGGPIVNLAKSDNVLFDGCTFTLVDKGVLPWSWNAVYRNCTMRQRSPRVATPKGKFLGRTTIEARVDLYGSEIDGVVIVNGRQLPPGHIG